ncbi:MAG: hypothetical protein N2316_09480 [Spirochaetes bacterium]|nr:hypothetical protein [Spirochaetota bacterium]
MRISAFMLHVNFLLIIYLYLAANAFHQPSFSHIDSEIPTNGYHEKMLLCGFFSDITDVLAAIRDGVADIKRFVESIVRFFETVWHVISFIGSLLGTKLVLLLVGVMIVSGLLSTIGIPRGKFSFVISLLIVNSIWVIGKKSFGLIDFSFIVDVAVANLILLFPFVAVQLWKKYFPLLKIKFVRIYARLKKQDAVLTIEKALNYFQQYKKIQNEFERAYLDDVKASHKGEVIISEETKQRALEIEGLLKLFTQKE